MKFLNSNPSTNSLKELPNFDKFLQKGQDEFCCFLKNFLRLENVYVQTNEVKSLKEWLNINEIQEVVKVPNADNKVCLFSQIIVKNSLVAFFPYVIEGSDVGTYASLKNFLLKIVDAVSDVITSCYLQDFEGSNLFFGDNFAKLLVSNCISTKKFSSTKFAHLIEKIEQLSAATFEGEFFSTGLIVSEHIQKFKKCSLKFREPRNVNSLKKREWFLANGKETFFLADLNSNIEKIFRKSKYSSKNFIEQYFDDFYLKKDLSSPDFIVRTVGPNEISVSDTDGKEFVKVENVWRYRHHKSFASFLVNKLRVDYWVAYAILYYTLRCSRNHISSIIWIPNDNSEKAIGKLTTSNRVRIWETKLNIMKEEDEPLVDKILASDGAMVVDKNGEILFESVFANMNKVNASNGKLAGSGETATRLLSSNGVAIKISQDGTIKIFFGNEEHIY